MPPTPRPPKRGDNPPRTNRREKRGRPPLIVGVRSPGTLPRRGAHPEQTNYVPPLVGLVLPDLYQVKTNLRANSTLSGVNHPPVLVPGVSAGGDGTVRYNANTTPTAHVNP